MATPWQPKRLYSNFVAVFEVCLTYLSVVFQRSASKPWRLMEWYLQAWCLSWRPTNSLKALMTFAQVGPISGMNFWDVLGLYNLEWVKPINLLLSLFFYKKSDKVSRKFWFETSASVTLFIRRNSFDRLQCNEDRCVEFCFRWSSGWIKLVV